MNLKPTLIMVALALAAGVVVIFNPLAQEEDEEPAAPWFYRVPPEDIETIEVTHDGRSVKFVRTVSRTYVFEDPEGVPASDTRFGGIPLLVSGPRAKRDLTVAEGAIGSRSQYGLDDPGTIVQVGLAGGRDLEFRLGRKTSDGRHHYGEVVGLPQLYLIASSWGDVLARLVTEPPFPRWYVERSPETIVEVNLYLGDPEDGATPHLGFRQEGGEWSVRTGQNDAEARPLDAQRWAEILPLLGRPTTISVAVPPMGDRSHAAFGITGDSSVIEIRFQSETERGTEFIDALALRIGGKTPDNRGYYAMVLGDEREPPVLRVDATWAETLLGLFDDVPYATGP